MFFFVYVRFIRLYISTPYQNGTRSEFLVNDALLNLCFQLCMKERGKEGSLSFEWKESKIKEVYVGALKLIVCKVRKLSPLGKSKWSYTAEFNQWEKSNEE
jgi:hypothetical protein